MQFGFYQANESTKFKQIPSLLCCGGVCCTDAGTSVGTDVCTGVGTTVTSVGTGADAGGDTAGALVLVLVMFICYLVILLALSMVFGGAAQIPVALRLCDLFQMWVRGLVLHAVQTVWFVMILLTASAVQTTLTFSTPTAFPPADFPSFATKMAGLVRPNF